MRRLLVFVALLMQIPGAEAFIIDNQTTYHLIVSRSLIPVASVKPLEDASCSHLSVGTCVSASDPQTARNELVTLSITTGVYNCTVRVPGDGLVEVKFNSLSQFQHHPFYSIPAEFICESSAEFNTLTPTNMSCPYTVADPYDDQCVVDSGTGFIEIVDRHPYSDTSRRHVRFLGTGDPQFNQGGGAGGIAGNDSADETLASMNSDINANNDIRGAIVSGDLTQVAVQSEFQMYKDAINPSSEYYFEGLGNHDLLCAFYGLDWYDNSNGRPWHSACDGRGRFAGEGGLTAGTVFNPPLPVGSDPNVSDDMKSFVFNHTTQSGFPPRNRVHTYGISPHYSWDWNDIHFVQLNLFPGNAVDIEDVQDKADVLGTADEAYVDPMYSLVFLEDDLARYAAPQDGTIGKPVVLIHHYSPASSNAYASSLDNWSAAQKIAYWNVIANYNIAAILNGHIHHNDTTISNWRRSFDQPANSTDRLDGRTSIQAYNLAAARGTGTGTKGVYYDITMDCTNRLVIDQISEDGTPTGRTHTSNFCSSFPQTSCPSDPNYFLYCDADIDGIIDKEEMDAAAGGVCPDPTKKDSDGDGVEDSIEDGNGVDPLINRWIWFWSPDWSNFPSFWYPTLAGDAFDVVVAGTYDGVTFAVGDRLIATVDNPSTTTYANNWHKAASTHLNGVFDAGEMNLCSTDTDGDGDLDGDDNCPKVFNADQLDTDGDDVGNVCDDEMDDDGDEKDNLVDNCPAISNADQADTDSDGVGDVCDDDIDNDGVPNVTDLADYLPQNCLDVDMDGCDDCSNLQDGYGPLPDNDVTNDGLDTDEDGICNIGDTDSDGDGLLDLYEEANWLDPLVYDRSDDLDQDGVVNIIEQMNGTDSNDPDHDDDGIRDGLDADPTVMSNLCSGADDDVDQMITDHYPCVTTNSVEVLSNTDVTDPGDLMVATPITRFGKGFKVQAGGELVVHAEGPPGAFPVPYIEFFGDCGGSDGDSRFFEIKFTPNPIGSTPTGDIEIEVLFHDDYDPGIPADSDLVFFHQQSRDTSKFMSRWSLGQAHLDTNDCTSDDGFISNPTASTGPMINSNSTFLGFWYFATKPAGSGVFRITDISVFK